MWVLEKNAYNANVYCEQSSDMIDGYQLGPGVRITKHPSCVMGQEAKGHPTAESGRAAVPLPLFIALF